MLFQTFLILMCLCMLLEFSRGFVVLRLPMQHCLETDKNRVSKQLWAQVFEPDKYYVLANTAVTEAGFFAVFVMTLLAYSIIQNTVGMSDMRVERKADKAEAEARMDKAEAERKADKEEMRAERKADKAEADARMDKAEAERKADKQEMRAEMRANKTEMRVMSFLTLLFAAFALKPAEVFLSKLFHT